MCDEVALLLFGSMDHCFWQEAGYGWLIHFQVALGEGGSNGDRIPIYAEVSQLADVEGLGF